MKYLAIASSHIYTFLVCQISSYFHCLPPRFTGCHQELSKRIKRFQRTFGKEEFQFSNGFLRIRLDYGVFFNSIEWECCPEMG